MHKDGTQSADDVSAAGLDRLGELVAARMGLHFPESRKRDLLNGAQALAREEGGKDAESLLRSLAAAPLTDRQIEILTAHLTVGETYFFRERKSLDAFRDHILPELVRQRAGVDRRLRIWCAGCSTGEEAYTLALILSEAIPDLDRWDVTILATDINPRSLDKARQGVFSEWSFRNLPDAERDRYFEVRGDRKFALRPRFREMVTFACHNLATDAYPSLQNNTNAMDVIFCRNVLMYFVPETVWKVVAGFRHCLVAGGWLVVSATEGPMLLASEFTPVPFEGAILYRNEIKRAVARKPAEARPAAGAAVPPAAGQPAAAPPQAGQPAHTYGEALSAYAAGLYAEAGDALQAVIGANRFGGAGVTEGQAFALMARINANQGNLDAALAWAEKAVAADKVNPGFYYLLATILEEQRRPADAVPALKRALYLDPGFVLAHFALGHLALENGKRREADRHFQNAAGILTRLPKDGFLPESEGLTAGRLLEIIGSITLGKDAGP